MNFQEILKLSEEGASVTSSDKMNFKLSEEGASVTSGDAQEHAPENVIEVVNGQEKIDLKEATLKRLEKRRNLNDQLFESITKNTIKQDSEKIAKLKESVFDAARSWILYEKDQEKQNAPRYRLQDFTNGGGGDGSNKGEPSAYEAWRRAIVDKKRKARLEQEEFDATNPFRSPTTTDTSEPTLDNQVDAFLSWWIQKNGGKD